MKINQNIKLPSKGRKALACSKEELIKTFTNKLKKELKEEYDDEEELEDEISDSYLPCDAYDTADKIQNDCDINFDLENCFYGWEDAGESTLKKAITSVSIDGKEVPYIPMVGGGDWEMSVFFIAYLDDKKRIRFYSPKPGNTFNPKTKSAFGNDDKADDDFCKSVGIDNSNWYEFKPDIPLMKKAIQARLIAC